MVSIRKQCEKEMRAKLSRIPAGALFIPARSGQLGSDCERDADDMSALRGFSLSLVHFFEYASVFHFASTARRLHFLQIYCIPVLVQTMTSVLRQRALPVSVLIVTALPFLLAARILSSGSKFSLSANTYSRASLPCYAFSTKLRHIKQTHRPYKLS